MATTNRQLLATDTPAKAAGASAQATIVKLPSVRTGLATHPLGPRANLTLWSDQMNDAANVGDPVMRGVPVTAPPKLVTIKPVTSPTKTPPKTGGKATVPTPVKPPPPKPVTQPAGGNQGGTAAPPDPGQTLLNGPGGGGGGDLNVGAGGGGIGTSIDVPDTTSTTTTDNSGLGVVTLGIIASVIGAAIWYFLIRKKKHGSPAADGK